MSLALVSFLLVFLTNPPPPTQIHSGQAIVEVRTDIGWVGPGQAFNLIVLLTPEEGWHVYWKYSGASGTPTEIEVNAPEGFKVGKPMFPRPSLFKGKEGTTYGYDKQCAIFIPVMSPKIIQTDEVVFEVNTYWLACKKICVIGEQEQVVKIKTNKTIQGPLHRDMRLKRWKNLLPKELSELSNATQLVSNNKIEITGTTSETTISFIGVEQRGVHFLGTNQLRLEKDQFVLTIPIELDYAAASADSFTIEGLLLLGGNESDPCYVVQVVAKSDTTKK
jgi:DsbC/DsbD-like thiol-disulfide interchange protein